VLQSEEALAKIRAITTCAFNAPVVLLICCDITEAWRNEENGINTGVMDASIVATHMMLQAADLGLGSCWVCRFGAEKVKVAFALPENIVPCCLLPLGYKAIDAIPSSRHELRKAMDEIVIYR
jgi:nitroreductase